VLNQQLYGADMKIACTGFVKKLTGSLGQANFILLEEMLRRGHEIDFYGWPGFNEPKELLVFPNFRYIPVPAEENAVGGLMGVLPSKIRDLVIPLVNILILDKASYGSLLKEVLRRNKTEGYQVLCFLGLFPPVTTQTIPIVSWVQSAPQTEWLYIHKLRSKLIKYCGFSPYLMYKLFYAIKLIGAKELAKNSRLMICPSAWTKARLVDYGIPSEKVYPLPHPIDTSLFTVRKNYQPKQKITFLYLGRITTRKRLDLLLDAFSLLVRERDDVHLKICGSTSGIEKGYMKLMKDLPFSEHLEYLGYLPQPEVPDLMSQADFLIQPSEGENFGSSVGEALCCGTPVILGLTNGTKDYAGNAAFVFDLYTPQSLKETMSQAISVLESHPEQLAIDARQAAEKYLSVATVTTQFEEILRKEALKKEICYR
jgi:glycosyltransferase involved in cell wall biosynthesis